MLRHTPQPRVNYKMTPFACGFNGYEPHGFDSCSGREYPCVVRHNWTYLQHFSQLEIWPRMRAFHYVVRLHLKAVGLSRHFKGRKIDETRS